MASFLADLNVTERVMAGDSTSDTLSTASAHFAYRTRSGKSFRGLFKGSYAVETQSQLILVARSSRRNGPNDAHGPEPLCNGVQTYTTDDDWVFLANVGFDCLAVTDPT